MAKIEMDVFYPYGVDKVWDALSEPDSLSGWYMKNEGFKAVPGQKFILRAKPVMGWKGVAYCQMLKVEKPNLISWTQSDSETGPPTFTLTWTLRAEGDGTRLTLLQDGLSGLRGQMIKVVMGAGWKKLLQKSLPKLLAR
jgi:uncharacterized protein YndB with AHSA1/START domain